MTTRLVSTLFFVVGLVVWVGCGSDDSSSVTRENKPFVEEDLEAVPDPVSRPTVSDSAKAPAKSPASDSSASPKEKPVEATATAATLGRQWKDANGQVLAVGEFVDLMENQVCLQKPDGTGGMLPLDQLCEADQAYVKQQVGDLTSNDPEQAAEDTAPPAESENTEEKFTGAVPGMRSKAEAFGGSSYQGGRKVVIPFDFESKFDEGRYGQMVGDMIWKKLQREGEFIVPETMLDVRDTCAANNVQPTPQTSLEEMKKIVQDNFGGQIAIWGSVERVPGHEWEIYDVVVKCVDFSESPKPKVIYEASARTNSVSEIPHLYVKNMLDKLYGREPGKPRAPDPLVEKNWQENPNLIVGDFEEGVRGAPKGWDDRGGQQREPLGNLVKWIPEAGNPKNHVIRFTFPASVGDSEGVMYYSKFFPVEENATYRFQCRYRSNGPNVKVFIKCCDTVDTTYREGKPPTYVPGGSNKYIPEIGQMREVYRSQQNLKGPANQWNTQTEDFTPKHTKYTPRFGRVMLYAYLGAGVVEFDDVVVKMIIPASGGASDKVRRHSLDTKVSIEEMEENIRRSEEAKEKK